MFLLGCCVGALSHFSWMRYRASNQRVETIHLRNENKMILLFEQYPSLMNLIKNRVNDPEHKTIREFFVIDPLALMSSSTPRLRFDLSEEMVSLVSALEQLGFIKRIAHASLLYRMSEDFIAHLKLPPANGEILLPT